MNLIVLLLFLLLVPISSQSIFPIQTTNGIQVNGISGFVFGGLILIPRDSLTYGVELYSYNISEKSFRLIGDLNPGPSSSNPRSFTNMTGQIYFIATTPEGETLFKLSPIGKVTKACDPWPLQSSPELLGVYLGSLYFTMNHPDIGRELFRYYADVQDWGIAYDIYPGIEAGNPTGALVYNGMMFFAGNTPKYGRELLYFDGKNLTLVADIAPNGASSQPTKPVPFQGKLFFSASVGGTGAELWVFDGVKTVSANDPLIQAFDSPSELTVAGDYMYFVPTLGRDRLWRFNGSVYESVYNVSSIITGLRPIISSEPNLYFWTLNSTSSAIVQGLWMLDKEKVVSKVANRADVGLFWNLAKSDQSPFVFQDQKTVYFAFEDQMIWGSSFPVEQSEPTLSCSECQNLCSKSCKETCKKDCTQTCRSKCEEFICSTFC